MKKDCANFIHAKAYLPKYEVQGMQKEAKMLLLTGCFIAIGLILSFFGTILAVDGLMQFEEILGTEAYTVTTDIDLQDGGTGVFAIIVRDGSSDNDIFVSIYDPSGLEIADISVSENSGQIMFSATETGKYKALIKNNHDTMLPITVAMGSYSGSIGKITSITGTAVLLMGLLGMIATIVYVFRLKRKKLV
ncbi:MAG: putative exported protein [Cenarchaeum symbiont of Oopsacas minuta]|nr:putative exported protein [Cenarchaeum symbiont of Oopsacas minuta]